MEIVRSMNAPMYSIATFANTEFYSHYASLSAAFAIQQRWQEVTVTDKLEQSSKQLPKSFEKDGIFFKRYHETFMDQKRSLLSGIRTVGSK